MGKAQHGNFLVAIKQEKGESARTSSEKPHGEEEVSSGARVPPRAPCSGVCAGAVPLLALWWPRPARGCGRGPRKGPDLP